MRDLIRDFKKLRPLLSRRDVWKLVILLGLMFLGSLMEAAGIVAVPTFVSLIMRPSSLSANRWFGDWFPELPDESTIIIVFWASTALLAFIILKNLFLAFVFYVQARIIASQKIKLGSRMFATYQSAPYEWHLQHSSSDLLRNIQNDTSELLSKVLMPSLDLIMAIIMTSAIITMLVLATPSPALLGLMVTGAGIYIVIRLFHKHLAKISQTLRREFSEIIKAIQQGFGALIDARILDCEPYLQKIYKDALKRQAEAQLCESTINQSTPLAIETFAIFGLLLILLILILTTDSLEAILPIIFMLGVATLRLKQLASKIAISINKINAGRIFISGIGNDLAELSTIESKKRIRAIGGQKIGDFKSLKLERVTYSYPDTTENAIQDVSLELKRGQSIAFIGSTGCGKSTLVNIMLGLLEPRSGHINVNGIDIHQDIEGWRTHLGYIQQSIYLIDDTIRANIAFGIPQNEISEERVWKALGSAQLREFIHSLPQGLDTIVGERGVRLSGGQRQRLGIARAIYPNPEILVMDEATSALDNKTEVEVMQAIQNLKRNRTLIMIAHRLSTVEDCDRLFFMRKGAIEKYGTYEELKRDSVSFREMATEKTA